MSNFFLGILNFLKGIVVGLLKLALALVLSVLGVIIIIAIIGLIQGFSAGEAVNFAMDCLAWAIDFVKLFINGAKALHF
jgi:hydrogenase/urease accessory protein HupE